MEKNGCIMQIENMMFDVVLSIGEVADREIGAVRMRITVLACGVLCVSA